MATYKVMPIPRLVSNPGCWVILSLHFSKNEVKHLLHMVKFKRANIKCHCCVQPPLGINMCNCSPQKYVEITTLCLVDKYTSQMSKARPTFLQSGTVARFEAAAQTPLEPWPSHQHLWQPVCKSSKPRTIHKPWHGKLSTSQPHDLCIPTVVSTC